MRDLVVLVGICVVVAGAAWFLLGGSSHNLLQPYASPQMVSVNPSSPPSDPKAEKKAQSKKAKQEHGASGTTALTAQQQEAPSPSAATSVIPPEIKSVPPGRISSRVPTPLEIRIGAEGVDVIRRFGAPLASAYTVDNGHYFETYFYRGERTQATIHLRDGKVYSVFPR